MLNFHNVIEIPTTMADAADHGLFNDSPNDWLKRARQEPDCACYVYLYVKVPLLPRVIYTVQGEPAIFCSVQEMLLYDEYELRNALIWH
jgi:hypothetical protein